MNDLVSRSQFASTAQRRLTLEVLQRFGPLPLEHIPRIEPVTDAQLGAMVSELAESGAVSHEWDPRVPGRRRVRLTEVGERRLRQGGLVLEAGGRAGRPPSRNGHHPGAGWEPELSPASIRLANPAAEARR